MDQPLAIGCMRLSTEPDRDDERSIAVLHAAFAAGVTLLDTADSYCWNDSETGHNERLIATALRSWPGDRSRIRVATKGGITRPDGRWEPDGRAKHLVAACERSCRALGVDAIDLYQLHAPDPRTPFSTSVRALAGLHRDGRVKSIGLSNVTVGQIEEARRTAPIDAVQVELSVWHDGSILSGVIEHCLRHGIRVLAYRPLGGRKARSRTNTDPALNEIAKRHNATPFEIALAWLDDISPLITPLPGVTRVETVNSVARARQIVLTDDDRLKLPHVMDRRPSRVHADKEVVLVMGLPAAGKSTFSQTLVADGYVRLNRDEAGGSLRGQIEDLHAALSTNQHRLVLDNTYVTRKSRAEVIRAAAQHGVPVRCVWLTTSLDEAQVNAVTRLIERYGRLPDDNELAMLRKTDVNAFPPTVLFRYQRELEPPDEAEGFTRVDRITFERRRNPAHINSAVIVWVDDPAKLEAMIPRLKAGATSMPNAGSRLIVFAWQPSVAAFSAAIARTGLSIDFDYCPHGAGPPRCWCRKPLPGLGVAAIHRHRLDPARCLYIGDGPLDPGFARRLGFTYQEAP
ncbi:MAG TPA: aldo/keto reductase [Vicinamibacterales bacterium]|nr:aldo/keto reductase [Vicinamibacterales bacterium]